MPHFDSSHNLGEQAPLLGPSSNRSISARLRHGAERLSHAVDRPEVRVIHEFGNSPAPFMAYLNMLQGWPEKLDVQNRAVISGMLGYMTMIYTINCVAEKRPDLNVISIPESVRNKFKFSIRGNKFKLPKSITIDAIRNMLRFFNTSSTIFLYTALTTNAIIIQKLAPNGGEVSVTGSEENRLFWGDEVGANLGVATGLFVYQAAKFAAKWQPKGLVGKGLDTIVGGLIAGALYNALLGLILTRFEGEDLTSEHAIRRLTMLLSSLGGGMATALLALFEPINEFLNTSIDIGGAIANTMDLTTNKEWLPENEDGTMDIEPGMYEIILKGMTYLLPMFTLLFTMALSKAGFFERLENALKPKRGAYMGAMNALQDPEDIADEVLGALFNDEVVQQNLIESDVELGEVVHNAGSDLDVHEENEWANFGNLFDEIEQANSPLPVANVTQLIRSQSSPVFSMQQPIDIEQRHEAVNTYGRSY